MDLNYYETLIAVADDCPVDSSAVPTSRGNKPTAAVLQYEMLADSPFQHTQEDVLFQSWFARQPGAEEMAPDEVQRLRDEFFAKPQPCLRSSPLPKKYGWGFRFDEAGRVALCPVESDEYRKIVEGKTGAVKVLKAMRSSRA
jgi:hypothetical protein